jgi:NADH:ubiquinone reductase (non-electrogenic)
MKKKILVVGFGWGSVGFLKRIDTNLYDVEVVSKNRSFLYTPLLAQNVKNNTNLLVDLNEINANISLHEKEVNNINFHENKVFLEDGEQINYDYLVLAHGAVANTFNIPGVKEHCCFLKSNEDANKIRGLLKALPSNSKIAVIGCGLTGSEVVGALIDYHKFQVYAIDAVTRPLMMFDSKLGNFAKTLWESDGVKVHMNHMVSRIEKNKIHFKDQIPIDFDIALWCGGIQMSPLTRMIMNALNMKNNKGIEVDDFLKVNQTNNVWALGDCAYTGNPPTAQVAYQQGNYLVKHFNTKFKKQDAFKFQNKGQIGYVGNRTSVYQNQYFKSSGNLVYYLNRLIHVMNAVTYRQMKNFSKTF